MDLKRYLIIGVIAVLSFMLLTEWVQFQESHTAATAAAQHQARQESHSNGDLPEQPSTATVPDSGDVPELPSAESTETEVVEPPSEQRIRVRSDVLELVIDPRGGDIVYAALPQHAAHLKTPDVPFTLLEDDATRTYIAQSGLIGPGGTDTQAGRALYHAEATHYELAEGQEQLTVDLTTEVNGTRITKRFILRRGDYAMTMQYLIDNQSEQPWQAAMFAQLKRDDSKDPGLEKKGFGVGMQSYLGAAIHTPEERYKKISFDDIAEKKLNEQVTGGWIAMVQHYFLSAWVPSSEQTHRFSTVHTRDGLNIIRFTTPIEEVAPGQQGSMEATLYVGPKDQHRLEDLSPGLELSVDYGFLWWLAQPLFWLLTQIHKLLGNWGWAIVIVTLMVKLAFFKLNATAYKSMANMRKVTPKIQEIRERYADDRQKQSQAMMELYKKDGINPLGGCLPILVQMPVFLALYWVLLESVELRHAPWILWIQDLSIMDPYFILPALMGASMFIQQKLNPPPPDPMQAKIMQIMPIMFTFFFLWFPAGLVLYWVVNNSLSIIQQYIITRRIEQSA